MKHYCMYCGLSLGDTEGQNDGTSHGICEDCFPKFVAGTGEPMQQFLDSLSKPVFLIDEDARIIGANDKGQRMTKLESNVISYRLGGEVFECTHAKLPEGCGKTIHCKTCTIRNTVTQTIKTGKAFDSVPAYMDLGDIIDSTRTRFLISTEKAGGFVLLRIDEVERDLDSAAN